MKRSIAVLSFVAVVCCGALAGEMKIPYASTGADFVADVDVVLAPMTLTAEQAESINVAKKEFAESRARLLANLVEQFTKTVGNPDEVFAKLENEATAKDERADLEAKVDKFASTEGRKFRSSALLLEGAAKRDIGRTLGNDAAKFRVELTRRQGLRGTVVGQFLLKMETAVPTLNLDAEQSEKLARQLAELRARQQVIVEEYEKAFAQGRGTDDVRKILSEGTPEEKAELSKRMRALRTQLEAEIAVKSKDTIAAFKQALHDFLSQEQQAQLEPLMK